MYPKNYKKLYHIIFSFNSRKDLNLIKKGLFLVKQWGIKVIITIIMLTRSSERIFNPSRALYWLQLFHYGEGYIPYFHRSSNVILSWINIILRTSILDLLRVSEANEVPNSNHIWVVSTKFKRLWNPKRNWKNLKYIFMIILELPESLTTMNRPDPTLP